MGLVGVNPILLGWFRQRGVCSKLEMPREVVDAPGSLQVSQTRWTFGHGTVTHRTGRSLRSFPIQTMISPCFVACVCVCKYLHIYAQNPMFGELPPLHGEQGVCLKSFPPPKRAVFIFKPTF